MVCKVRHYRLQLSSMGATTPTSKNLTGAHTFSDGGVKWKWVF